MEHSLEYAVGILIVLAATLVIAVKAKAKGGVPGKFDERQQALRGRAYKAAFWTLNGYLALCVALEVLGIRWAQHTVLLFVGICFSVTVFALICIWTDAYFAINQKPRFYMGLFAALCVVNALCAAGNVLAGEPLTTEGLLNYHAINAVVAAMFLPLLAAIVFKARLEKRRDGGEQ